MWAVVGPWVRTDLFQCIPFLRIVLQHALHQLLELLWWPLRELTPESVGFLPEQMVELSGWEWILSHMHHEETYTQWEHIDLVTPVLASTLNFRGHVDLCAAFTCEPLGLTLFVSHECTECKICNLDLVSFKKDVVQFQVSMADALWVQVG